jgi:hypothetical protein
VPTQESKADPVSKILRLPEELNAALKKQAELNGRSVNAEIVYRLQQSLSGRGRDASRARQSSAEYDALGDLERAMLQVFRRMGPEKQLALISLFK